MWDAISNFFSFITGPIRWVITLFELGSPVSNLMRIVFGSNLPDFLVIPFYVILGSTMLFFILGIIRKVF